MGMQQNSTKKCENNSTNSAMKKDFSFQYRAIERYPVLIDVK